MIISDLKLLPFWKHPRGVNLFYAQWTKRPTLKAPGCFCDAALVKKLQRLLLIPEEVAGELNGAVERSKAWEEEKKGAI